VHSLRLASVALALAAWQTAAASDARLVRAEMQYADWLDSTSAVATIDSGLTTRIDGRDRRGWEERRQKLTATLLAALAKINESALDADDARLLDAMRKGLVSNALDPSQAATGSDANELHTRCADRTRTGGTDPAPLQLALYACLKDIGNRLVFEGKPITRITALQWLQEIDDSERRKRLFLSFAPLWSAVNADDQEDSPYRRMISLSAAEMRRSARSPIDDAAAALGMTTAQSVEWLTQILAVWRTHSHGPALEPWDYWYASASTSRELKPAIPLDAVLPISEHFYRDLGADLQRLGVRHDLEVRPGKAPLADSDIIRIGRRIGKHWRPAIPRVSANYEQGGLLVLNELIHEDGHAVHYAALRTRPAFYSLGDDVFFEAFADVTSWENFEPDWQRKYLGRSSATAASLRELYSSVMLDVAWALFEVRMLQDPNADPNVVWTDITARYFNIVPHPELSWWALRVQLVRWPGYMINYGLGAVLTADIRQRTAQAIGSFDTGNPHWYAWTSAHLLRYGATFDTATLLRQFLGRPVSTDALFNQLRRLD
jgi:hypothetical protein